MTDHQRLRYARQLRLPEVGDRGQRRLARASVLVVGAGGLGSPALHHLVASGVGTVGIVEFDTVDVSNLHRQTLFSSHDLGIPKLDAAVRRLTQVNDGVTLVAHPTRLTSDNADALVGAYDVVLDGSDTFATRYAVNDASVATRTPLVYASVNQFSGQASVFGTETGPCYRCLFPDPPPPGLIPNCEDGGVLGVVPSILGSIQATEALKLILGIGDPLIGRLLLFDALAMEFREIQFASDPDCPACGPDRRATDHAEAPREITVAELYRRLTDGDAPVLVDVREGSEHQAFDIGGRLIPLSQLDVRLPELADARQQDVVVYCASGGRSGRAVQHLREHGFHATSLRGGLDAWRAAGFS